MTATGNRLSRAFAPLDKLADRGDGAALAVAVGGEYVAENVVGNATPGKQSASATLWPPVSSAKLYTAATGAPQLWRLGFMVKERLDYPELFSPRLGADAAGAVENGDTLVPKLRSDEPIVHVRLPGDRAVPLGQDEVVVVREVVVEGARGICHTVYPRVVAIFRQVNTRVTVGAYPPLRWWCSPWATGRRRRTYPRRNVWRPCAPSSAPRVRRWRSAAIRCC